MKIRVEGNADPVLASGEIENPAVLGLVQTDVADMAHIPAGI